MGRWHRVHRCQRTDRGGFDLHQVAKASASWNANHHTTANFSYVCRLGAGCTGSTTFSPGPALPPDAIRADVSGRLQSNVWVRGALRGFAYTDDIDYLEVGLQPKLQSDIWGYHGNDCGDADGDGVPETVSALTLDVDASASLFVEGSFLDHSKELEIASGSKHLIFKDLLGSGSTALSPMLKFLAEARAGTATAASVEMRPCWPYQENVTYAVAWNDIQRSNAEGPAHQAALTTNTFSAQQTATVTATALHDAHGRWLGQSTSRSIQVGPGVPTTSGNGGSGSSAGGQSGSCPINCGNTYCPCGQTCINHQYCQ